MNSEKWRQSEKYTVTNDKSQGSIAKRLSWDGLLYYKFITLYLLMKDFFNRRTYGELQAKWLIASYSPFALQFCSQRCRICQISKITCVL